MQGINLVGYLNHVIGLGESARQFASSLEAGGIPHSLAAVDLGPTVPMLNGAEIPWVGEADLPYDTTVLWCNPDVYGKAVDPTTLAGKHVVARWAWELAEVPDSWSAVANEFSEIWTASRFVADAVSSGVDVPVRVMRQAVATAPPAPLDRQRWGIPDDHTMFLYMFDYHSMMKRKNPLGLVEAFRTAFPQRQGVTLLIKTINAPNDPVDAATLQNAVADIPSIRLVDVAVSGYERASLLAGCDVYVSLHRTEGFGMTMAEAMSYGRPVIATGFGGNLEYMTPDNSYIVPASPTEVGTGVRVYPPDGIWGEPDLSAAASMMRQAVDNPEDARRRGAEAAKHIETFHSHRAVGESVQRELERLAS